MATEKKATKGSDDEICASCGAVADAHPIIGVTFEPGDGDEAPHAIAHPICQTCHTQPPRALGMHFFPRGMKAVALSKAGSSDLGR